MTHCPDRATLHGMTTRQGNPNDSPWRSPTAAMRKTPKFSTTLPADVVARIGELAAQWRVKKSDVIARLVREWKEEER